MDDHKELLARLTTDREWAQANEYDAPICLQDDLSAAITALANYEQITEWLRRNGFESFGALTAAFEQVKRERDAAEKDIQRCCETCANAKMNSGTGELCPWFDDCKQVDGDHWEWRGPQKET